MKKFQNIAATMERDGLRGFQAAYWSLVNVHEEPLYVVRRQCVSPEKLALVSGGGSGHEPLHIGMVGFGMLDAACPGQIFTSPTPAQIVAAARTAQRGKGILFLVKNYSGDQMNFEMAGEALAIDHATIIIADETVVLSGGQVVADEYRRGLSGVVIYEKMLGALAESGADLEACLRLGESLGGAVRSMGVALRKCALPSDRAGNDFLAEGDMEVGIGIHGEPGRACTRMTHADDIAEMLVTAIADDLALSSGEEILLLVNGMGGTPPMELYLLFGGAMKICQDKGFVVSRSLVGSYVTCLDTAGCLFTLCRLDRHLTALWDYPVRTPSLNWGR